MSVADPTSWRNIDRRVLAFERASAASDSTGPIDLRSFLPEESDPAFANTLRELILVDIERRCELGQSVSLQDYARSFPAVASDQLLHDTFRRRFTDDEGMLRLDVGEELEGFEIVEELGSGSFARVYLARQPALANRLVVIKVSSRSLGEIDKLARLQHTNIVPLFSAQQRVGQQILCMPFLGRTTLNDRKPESTRQTLQWIAGLAEGLGHAHRRGLLHLDIKPANVLISDEGVPMLLDFNLSMERDSIAPLTGGTLAYMSPEQIRLLSSSFGASDAEQVSLTPASDVYAMGLLLFELLSGKRPFSLPAHVDRNSIGELLRVRLSGKIDDAPLRHLGSAPRAIIARCLAPDPSDRYSNGDELAEDLRRELADLPLQHAGKPTLLERVGKWTRRHPRLATAIFAAALSTCALGVIGRAYLVRGVELARAREVEQLDQFSTLQLQSKLLLGVPAPTPDQLREGLQVSQQAISLTEQHVAAAINPIDRAELMVLIARGLRFQSSLPGQNRDGLFQQAVAWNERSLSTHPTVAARMQRAILRDEPIHDELLPSSDGIRDTSDTSDTDARSLYLQGVVELANARWREAERLLRASLARDPRDPAVWSTLGQAQLTALDPSAAVASFQTASALAPRDPTLHYYLGVAYLASEKIDLAVESLTRCLEIDADHAAALTDRGLAYFLLNQMDRAVADLDRSISRAPEHTRAYLLRAQALDEADPVRAERDHREGIMREPGDEQSAVSRGVVLLDDPQRAIGDFELALRFNPNSLDAMQNLAYVYSELLGDPLKGASWLDRLIATHPEHVEARTSRAVLLARAGRLDIALEAAGTLRKEPLIPALRYQLAGVYAHAATRDSSQLVTAIDLLRDALSHGYGHELLNNDRDLDPIRASEEFTRLIAAAKEIMP